MLARVAQWIEHSTLVPLTCGGVSSSRLERSLFARDRDGLRPVAAAAQRSDEVNGRAGRVQIWGHVKLSPQNSAVELELHDRVVGSGFTQQALQCLVGPWPQKATPSNGSD